MKYALIAIGLAVGYVAGNLLWLWRSRKQGPPPPPPGGWRPRSGWDDEPDDWPGPPPDARD